MATGVVLGAWAGLFWFLLLTDRWSLYLSTRTFWVVPTGAILLTIAAVGTAGDGARAPTRALAELDVLDAGRDRAPGRADPRRCRRRRSPGTPLGRRGGFVGSGVSVSTSDIASGTLSFVDVAAAQSSKTGMAALRSRAGEQVTLEGFVWRQDGAAADEILLTRYVVTCCVADATIAQVRVVNVPPGRFAADDWVSVTGRIYPLGSEILVDASAVQAIPQPERPYLTP